MRVSFSGRTRPCQGRGRSSILLTRTKSSLLKTAQNRVLHVKTVDNSGDFVDKRQKLGLIIVDFVQNY